MWDSTVDFAYFLSRAYSKIDLVTASKKNKVDSIENFQRCVSLTERMGEYLMVIVWWWLMVNKYINYVLISLRHIKLLITKFVQFSLLERNQLKLKLFDESTIQRI